MGCTPQLSIVVAFHTFDPKRLLNLFFRGVNGSSGFFFRTTARVLTVSPGISRPLKQISRATFRDRRYR